MTNMGHFARAIPILYTDSFRIPTFTNGSMLCLYSSITQKCGMLYTIILVWQNAAKDSKDVMKPPVSSLMCK